MDKTNTSKVYTLTKLAMSVAILCILGPIIIPLPFSPVPISVTQIAIYISIYILGYKLATYSVIIYILMGLVGLPIFSGYSGGLHKLAGPTGGYIIGFIFLSFVTGIFIDNYSDNICLTIIGYIIGNLICYIIGTIWLSYNNNILFKSAILIGICPYIIADILKVIISIMLGNKLRKLLQKLIL